MITKITIIGTGNVAAALVKAFDSKKITLVQLFSRDKKKAQQLIQQLKYNKNTEAISSFNQLNTSVDLIIVAVNDDAILEVVKPFLTSKILIVHTSGSVGLEVFNGIKNAGVFYPLQTFSKASIINMKDVPFCIEGNSIKTTQQLTKLANQISNNVYEINSKQRNALHLAAVFANNFTNCMYAIAEEITKKNNIDFSILKPLILETATKINQLSPKEAQTGPAKRKDKTTIQYHFQLLKNDIELQKIYELLSKRIESDLSQK